MRRLALSLCFLLLWTLPAWGQGQLIAGDRTIAGKVNAGLTTGTATAYVLTLNPALPSYVSDQQFAFRVHLTNTGAATLAVNAAGVKALKKWQSGTLVDLAAGDLQGGMSVVAYYDGTVMQVLTLGTAAGGGAGGVPTTRAITTTAPLTGGGDLSTDRAHSCPTCVTSVAALTTGLPVIGSGGQATAVGTRSGTTTKFVSMDASTPAPNDCAKFDTNGNLTTSGAACGAGAGGTGDVSDVGTCTGAACFTTASPSGRLTFAPSVAPATPGPTKADVYVDSTSKNLAVKDDAGLVKHGVQTSAAVTGQYLTGIADDGLVTKATPTKADVGLGNVDNTSDTTKNSATAILSNKQIDPRVVLCTATANVITPNMDVTDVCYNYGLTAPTTIANPTGANIRDQQRLELTFKTAAPQALTFGSAYNAECGLPLPTSTTGDNTTYNHFLFRFSTTSAKWCLIASTKAPLRSVVTLGSSATYSCPFSSAEQCSMQMTGATGTVTMGVTGGTPDDGQLILLGIMCTNSQTLSWPSGTFTPSRGFALPTACPASTTVWLFVGFRYSSVLSRWQAMASTE
jgi:hypothetical protein